MSIQQTINQAMTVGTALYTQSSGYEAKKQQMLHEKAIAAKKQELKGSQQLIHAANQPNIDPELKHNIVGRATAQAQELAYMDPTTRNVTAASKLTAARRQETEAYDALRALQANQRSQRMKEAIQYNKSVFQSNLNKWGEL